MDSASQIAEQMTSAINNDDTWLKGFIEGVIDFPVDLFYLSYDFIDTENRTENRIDKERFIRLIHSGNVSLATLKDLIRITFDEYFEKLDQEQITRLLEVKAFKVIGGLVTKSFLIGDLGAIFATKFAYKFIGSAGVLTVLSLGAMVSRAIYTSRSLNERNPALYWKLRSTGNLDLLYFLLENKLKPFEETLQTYYLDRELFNNITELFIREMEK